MQRIIKVLKLKIIMFDLIDFGTAKFCGNTNSLIWENTPRKGGERLSQGFLKALFYFVSVYPFFISPMEDIIAAYFP